MTNSRPSDSDVPSSAAFELLHEKVRRWIWRNKWDRLRDAQERAVPSILAGEHDLLIAAATAAGKTEAAFLPICSRLVDDAGGGVRALYVGPLKALINDQFRRLEDLCRDLNIPVHRWHGDVTSDRKKRLIREPGGILLITPESLEALFVVHGHRLREVFAPVDRVVLDEVHAYIGSDRGRQLQSLLHRLEHVVGRRTMRIGLSATLGDETWVAADYLRPGERDSVELIESAAEGRVKLQVRGYGDRGEVDNVGKPKADAPDVDTAFHAIARHIFECLRGQDNLVFANTRQFVEKYADRLRRDCESRRLPLEFYPHHGNLSKELREDVEERLKGDGRPTTAICTSTLEMGIDIGDVASVAQIGAPFSVASLRQRLGRSGRRGDPAVLRVYIAEPEMSDRIPRLDTLRPQLVQAVAMIELLLERWCEPPKRGALHLSTLVHQTMSLIAERGGVRAFEAWKLLCDTGPFRGIEQATYGGALRCMGAEDLIVQSDDGTLLLGDKGEKIVGHFSFFPVFPTPEEFRILHDGRSLGTTMFGHSIVEGLNILFAGRRWRIVSIKEEEKTIVVVPTGGGKNPPRFEGSGGLVHDRIRRKMTEVYARGDQPAFLDEPGNRLLLEGRRSFVRYRVDEDPIIRDGDQSVFFLCRGDRIMNTVMVQLVARELQVMQDGPALLVKARPSQVKEHLESLAAAGPGDALALAHAIGNKVDAKFDWALDKSLLAADYAARALDTKRAHEALVAILA